MVSKVSRVTRLMDGSLYCGHIKITGQVSDLEKWLASPSRMVFRKESVGLNGESTAIKLSCSGQVRPLVVDADGVGWDDAVYWLLRSRVWLRDEGTGWSVYWRGWRVCGVLASKDKAECFGRLVDKWLDSRSPDIRICGDTEYRVGLLVDGLVQAWIGPAFGIRAECLDVMADLGCADAVGDGY